MVMEVRPVCYVDDLVERTMRLMNGTHSGLMNIRNPGEFTIRQFAEPIRKCINPDLPLIEKPLPSDDSLQRKLSIQLAKCVLYWQPTIEIEQGLDLTFEYFRNALNV